MANAADDVQGRAAAAGRTAKGAAQQATGQVDSETVTKVGRFGVAGLGIVYLLLAWVSLQVALGGSEESADNTGALRELSGNGGGRVLLGVLAVAFVAYAAWQAYEGIADFHRYTGGKRTLKRVAAGVKAVIGLALAVTCGRLVAGGGQKDASEQQADFTARLMEQPGGRVLVVAMGAALIGFAGFLVRRAYTKSFREKLEGPLSRSVELLGVVGYTARGVAFGILGVLVVVAAVQADPNEARGLDHALKTLAGAPFGTVGLVAVALGLAAFGVFELMTARRAREG